MAVRLDPIDEYMHELGPETNFNESMYFNVYDPAERIGGWFRIGNRANEGYAEMTVCLYLPDGKVGFMFQRPKIANNDQFEAAGLRIDVVEPFKELTLRYEGKVAVLANPLDMVEPKKAFIENPREICSVDLRILGMSPMFGGEPDTPHEAPGEEFAKGHYEQLLKGVGTITVGGQTWNISGHGLRDHSWGPRYWQAPWYYRWLTGNVGGEFGFMGSFVAKKDRIGSQGGFVWEGDGTISVFDECDVETTWRTSDGSIVDKGSREADADDAAEPGDIYHQEIAATFRSTRLGKEWKITGSVMNLIPLRNRRTTPDGDELLTRISEGMTEWTLEDGRKGYGLSEYLDQIIDGRPVSYTEE
jgi:hypothetical protein